ncbi:PPE domain-containing protein [Mycobacterium sp. pR1184]|uniref:PPE domain-containing protein n=1 Tax=Mycobacterium sp. pR1184 TaxID=3238981 RepID=UPI00351B5C26
MSGGSQTRPYLAWLNSAAAQAEQVGTQANAAATAFEAAYAATVPPSVVAASGNLRADQAATNIFGQNTPAIAAADAEYAGMWAQDAEAMNGYATASNTAAQIAPFTSPLTNTTPGAAERHSRTVTQAANSPEVNSVRMYSGPGSGSMLAAVAA